MAKTDWRDKIVLVTGGSSGLGRVIAEEFGARGAVIVSVGLEATLLEQSTEEMKRQGVTVVPICADITNQADVARVFDEVRERFGHLDVLVNNAGRTHRGKIMETTPDEFQSLFDLNVLGTIRCSQAAVPLLLPRRGHIINIGSLAAKSASRWTGAYPVTKFAVAAFSQQLRLELGPEGLHVLLVCPGPVKRSNERLYKLKQTSDIPEAALLPGAGVQLSKIDPHKLAKRILVACEKRQPELVVPGKARILFALAQLWPALADWIVIRKTGGTRPASSSLPDQNHHPDNH
ncbi:MAG: SDR family NAD(P)-dependent oxidoreductase [Planctomycetia bacterium]|nr:SDR family NAD(P)-dependent oxidoreductase [Planctomycetia bacterium]